MQATNLRQVMTIGIRQDWMIDIVDDDMRRGSARRCGKIAHDRIT